MRRALAGLLILLAAGCDSGTEPDLTMEEVAGAYVATAFTYSMGGTTRDVLATGGSLLLFLEEDGTTVGQLYVPAGGEGGSDLAADMSGTWSLDGDEVSFSQSADTFIRDRVFTYDGGRLLLDDPSRIELVLTRQ